MLWANFHCGCTNIINVSLWIYLTSFSVWIPAVWNLKDFLISFYFILWIAVYSLVFFNNAHFITEVEWTATNFKRPTFNAIEHPVNWCCLQYVCLVSVIVYQESVEASAQVPVSHHINVNTHKHTSTQENTVLVWTTLKVQTHAYRYVHTPVLSSSISLNWKNPLRIRDL